MKRFILLIAVIPAAHAWTGVAGGCAAGDYSGPLTDVLRHADRENTVDVVVCGEHVLPWGESIEVEEFRMTGGVIRAERPVYLKVEAEEIKIRGTAFENVYLILKGRNVSVQGIRIEVRDSYCVKIVAETADINGLHALSCERGIVGRVDRLFLKGYAVTNVADATDVDVREVHVFPVKELVTVERVVEKNAPCRPREPCDVSPYVRRILRLENENERLSTAVIEAKNAAEECRQELESLKRSLGGGAPQADISLLAALFAAGLGVGYLLGRT